ncbi:TonB-dependent receptor plug domain-containing protein [Altererythrobacter sp. Root672]|uniref:TonB-dependent receptor plug domain-containing protein n=1 Tax=Altererythrobacter sp. Root672 TaxID=1736584 RepID=UPI0006F94613|nr:TonB-dependent receptor [Altererythrobacter sp. Root672]
MRIVILHTVGGSGTSSRKRQQTTRLGAQAISALLLTTSTVAFAQDPVAETDVEETSQQEGSAAEVARNTIVVTGTATPVERQKIGNTLTVIEGETIETKRTAYLQDILREVPGLAVNQSGSFGSLTQVRIRGADGNHVLVLIDGIEVSAVGSGEFDFSSLLANNIDRVEVLRGPQSGLYGSNALAGVINVITKGGDGPSLDGLLEYGSFDSVFGRGALTVGDRETFVSANAIYRQTDGVSSAAIGTEPDGDKNLTLYLRGGAKLADIARIDGTLRFVDKDTDTDGFDFSGGPNQGLAIDDDSYSNTEDWSGGLALTVEPIDRWENVFSVAYSHDNSVGGAGGFDIFGSEGERLNLSARSTIGFDTPSFANATHHVTVFVEHEEEGYRNTFPFDPSQEARQERSLLGYGAEYRLDLFDSLFLRGAIRHDENDDFEDATTYSVSGSWVLGSTRLHASYGTGVTNPTFTEQFGYIPGEFVGNPDLLPERAKGFDFGVEQRLFDDKLLFDATYFNSTLRDEIISVYPSVENDLGESNREGIELAARVNLGSISFGGSYTYLDATDPDGGEEVRRPKNQASFDVTGRFGSEDRVSVSAGLIYNGEMLDVDYRNYFTNGFVAEKSPLEAHTVVRLAGSYKLNESVEFFARLENALDADYEEALSYGAPGRAVYGGLRFVLP